MTTAFFHLAFPVKDIGETRRFYCDVLGCKEGRSTDKWIDFDFYGHQISAHLRPDECVTIATGEVDGKKVPVRHFGAVLAWDDWCALRDRLVAKRMQFVIEPYVRFAGKPGEQGTMFFLDPSGNALEFKGFKDMGQLFAA